MPEDTLQNPDNQVSSLRAQMAAHAVRHQDVARLLGITEQQFSLFINARRTPPDNWVNVAQQAINRVKEANALRESFLSQQP